MSITLKKKTTTTTITSEKRPLATKRLLGILAHPGNEGLIGGALLHYHTLGIETGLVYLTRGEAGQKPNGTPDRDALFGQIREAETRSATSLLHVDHLWFLDYRDSGEIGTPDNKHPQALLQAPPDPIVKQLASIMRHFSPQVVLTLDAHADNGHPDHFMLHKYTTQAFHALAQQQQPHAQRYASATMKLYYASFARRQLTLVAEWLWAEAYDRLAEKLESDQLGFTDEQISVQLNVERWEERKAVSWSQHGTQANSQHLLTFLPSALCQTWRSTEYYQLGSSQVGSDLAGENDLFARIP